VKVRQTPERGLRQGLCLVVGNVSGDPVTHIVLAKRNEELGAN